MERMTQVESGCYAFRAGIDNLGCWNSSFNPQSSAEVPNRLSFATCGRSFYGVVL